MAGLIKTLTEVDRFTRLYTGGKVRVSGDGEFLACGCEAEEKKGINVISVKTGNVLLTIPADADEFTTFVIHPLLPLIVTAGRSRQLRSWTLDLAGANCRCAQVWKAHRMPVLDMAYDPTGTLVASGSSDGCAMVFETGKCTHVFRGHGGVVSLVAFHPTAGRLHLFSASADTTLRVWDLKTKACLAVLRSHVGLPTALAFSDDGTAALSAGRDQLVNVWSLDDYSLRSSIATLESMEAIVVLPAETGAMCADAVGNPLASPNAKRPMLTPEPAEPLESAPALHFATAGESGLVRYWDAGSGRCTRRQAAEPNAAPLSALSQLILFDDTRQGARGHSELLAVTADHNFIFHSTSTMARTRCVVGNNDEITDLRCLRVDGPRRAEAAPLHLVGPSDRGRTCGSETGSPGAASESAGRGGGEGPVCKQLAVATNSEQVRLFRTGDMGCRLLAGHTDVVLALDASVDHTWLASSSKDCTIRVWHASTATCHAVCEGHVEAVGAICFARKASLLISGSKDKTTKLWDLRGLKGGAGPAIGKNATFVATRASAQLHRPHAVCSKLGHAKEINAVTVAPNDALAVTASQDRTLLVWRLEESGMTGLAQLRGHKRAVWCASFSPVDKVVASGSGDMTLKVWSMTDFSCLRTFQGHTSSVLKLHFVGRGQQLLSSGSDGLIKLWSLKSAECAASLDRHEHKVWALDVIEGPAGVEVWSGSADSVMVRWRDSTLEMQAKGAVDEAQLMEHEQDMANAVRSKEFGVALNIALQLKRPRALRQVLEQLLPTGDGEAQLRLAVAALDAEGLVHCLGCARDWNLSAAHAVVAHRLLNVILKAHSQETLLALPNIKTTFEAIIPYSERHFERLDRLAQGAHFVGFTLAASRVLVPEPQEPEGSLGGGGRVARAVIAPYKLPG